MTTMRFTFDPRRTAQAAEWLLHRHDGLLTRGHLLKLLYLADRQCLIESGAPITGDYMVSMNQGPVLSITYDLIKGASGMPEAEREWQMRVITLDPYRVRAARRSPSADAYDRLSERHRSILTDVDVRFGSLSWRQLSDYTHQLPEWENPAGSMRPIAPETVLAAGNIGADRTLEIEREALEDRSLRELLGGA